MIRLNEPIRVRLKSDIRGLKEIALDDFIIERTLTVAEVIDTDFNKMNIALHNFILRRTDVAFRDESEKVFYGHSVKNNLGYFITSDEIYSIYKNNNPSVYYIINALY